MQKVTLPEVFPSRKRRFMKESSSIGKTSGGIYTRVRGRTPVPQPSISDLVPEIVWDNSSPSPAKESTQRGRKGKSGKDVHELLKKLGSIKEDAEKRNSCLADQSLLSVWMRNSCPTTPTEPTEAELSSTTSPKIRGSKRNRDKGKTPKRVVGRQRSRLGKLNLEIKDEFCKIVMALSNHSEQHTKKKPPTKDQSSRTTSGQRLDLDLASDLFDDELEPLGFPDEIAPCNNVGKLQNESKRTDVSPDLFSEDDFDTVILDDIVHQCDNDTKEKKSGGQFRLSKGVNGAAPSAAKLAATCRPTSNGVLTSGEDLFGEEDDYLDLVNEEGNDHAVDPATSRREVGTHTSLRSASHYSFRTTSHATKNRSVRNQETELTSHCQRDTRSIAHCVRTEVSIPLTKGASTGQGLSRAPRELHAQSSSPSLHNRPRKTFCNFSRIRGTDMPPLGDASYEDDEIFLTMPLDEPPMSSTQKCNPGEIAEKKRRALERLAYTRRKRSGPGSTVPL